MKKLHFVLCLFFISFSTLYSQNAFLGGYIYEEDNRGYIENVEVTILFSSSKQVFAKLVTNEEGYFSSKIPIEDDFIVKLRSDDFYSVETDLSTKGIKEGEKLYIKIELQRKPGYLLKANIFDKGEEGSNKQEAIYYTNIEIFNLTKNKEELIRKNNVEPGFDYTFKSGNHYVILIRKEGYLAKRVDAKVNVEGCILCLDGVKNIASSMGSGGKFGVLNATIEMDKIEYNKPIKIENIYYDLDKWEIRPDAATELDKLVGTLKENPNLIVELRSHTDSRGKDKYNLKLSKNRAKAAVEYIVNKGGIKKSRINAKGFGETKLINECKNGVKCSERKHQKNRRTELVILGYDNTVEEKSLAEIIKGERYAETIDELHGKQTVELNNDNVTPELDIEPEIEVEKPYDFTPEEPVEIEKPEKPVEVEKPENKVGEETKINTPRANHTKSIPANYSGYRVQFFTSEEELSSDHRIFTQHGNIFMERLEGGTFTYLLGSFDKKKKAKEFLTGIILQQYPDAKVIAYKYGRRVE